MQLIQAATGFIVHRSRNAFLGTCFAYETSNLLLTAAHCVRGLSASDIGVAIPTKEANDPGLDVKAVYPHPKADIAILELSDMPIRVLKPFWSFETAVGWGDEVIAFGYPEDTTLSGPRPTPRMFRGSIQRFYSHSSHLGYSYLAAELSFTAPAGLSGGPVCWIRDQSKVVGVVTENVESSTYLASVEELQADGKLYRQETRNMVNYGIAVALHDIADWLEEHTPW